MPFAAEILNNMREEREKEKKNKKGRKEERNEGRRIGLLGAIESWKKAAREWE